ncbi:unnamed protein product [Allacma fusca]|uniref:Uncharacterized protein n=2 Tax=Allacma fusca TaxID=39272 RepID=A0A8J2NT47_9HEXA|nr:unnamed protein product [Allacma fusca]
MRSNKLLKHLLLLVSISLAKAFPVDQEEVDDVFPEYLKPALDNNGDEHPPEIEEDEVLDEDIEFGETADDLDEDEVSPVPILIPGKENTKIQNEPKSSPTTDEPTDDEMLESDESESTNNLEKDDRSEEGDESSERDTDVDEESIAEESILEESTEEIPFEDNDDEILSRHARDEPMRFDSKPPNHQHHATEAAAAVTPSSKTSNARKNPQDENDAVIIEACGDYERTCGSNAITRSDEVACKALREKCEIHETGDIIDAFICPKGKC